MHLFVVIVLLLFIGNLLANKRGDIGCLRPIQMALFAAK